MHAHCLGKNNPFFTVEGAQAHARDMPGAETHILDAGHFALEEVSKVAELMLEFLSTSLYFHAHEFQGDPYMSTCNVVAAVLPRAPGKSEAAVRGVFTLPSQS